MNTLKLSQAEQIIDAALADARQRRLMPIVVAVLDAGGHLIAFKREDSAGFLRFDIAFGKAWGALGLGMGTRQIVDRAEKLPAFFAALASTSQGRVLPSPGGVLLAASDGEIIGAVGISGDLGDNDEACALAGIRAVGLVAIPGPRTN